MLILVGALTEVLGTPVYEIVASPLARMLPVASGPPNTADVEYVTVVANAEAPQKRSASASFFIR
jgi:hypothetical protein